MMMIIVDLGTCTHAFRPVTSNTKRLNGTSYMSVS